MTKQELYLILQSKTFIVRQTNIIYQFDEDTVIVNGKRMWNYEIVEDENNLYLKSGLVFDFLKANENLKMVVVSEQPCIISLLRKNDAACIVIEEESNL